MGSAFGLWNSTDEDQWYVLRSSESCFLLRLLPNGNKFIRMRDGEIVTSFCFSTKEKAEASIGKGEAGRFVTVEAIP